MRRFLIGLLVLLSWQSLLRAEAPFKFESTPGKLPKDVVPVQYDLTLAPDIEKRTFTGQETVQITLKKATNRCVLNAQELEIKSAELASESKGNEPPSPAVKLTIAVDDAGQTCTLTFPNEFPAGNYRLTLRFAGKINQDGAGLFDSTYTNAEGKPETMLCTQMEPTDARRMFPCWDEPSFRAKFRLSVQLPQTEVKLQAVSNMPLEKIVPTADGAEYTFHTTPPMASYLVVLAIGNFDVLEGNSDGTTIRVIAPKGRVQNGKYALESAGKILHFYNEYFGVKFPLPKLDLISVSGGASFGGAMENWGGITFAEPLLLYDPATTSQSSKETIFEVIAHEMAHQWFGDLVTTAWWDNLWLNEGFAEWMGETATDHFNPDWQYWHNISDNKTHAMVSDALSTTHPIQQPVVNEMDAERAFDEITYNKGQSFIRMLENYLGPEKFRDGLRRYMKAHAYGNTTTADLWTSLDAASGQPVSAIAAQWTEQPGLPLVSVSRDPAKPDEVKLSQRRFTVHDPHAAPLRWKIPVTYAAVGSDARGSLLLDADATVPAPAAGNPLKFNAGGGGYYRVAYDEATLRPLLERLNDLIAPDQNNLLGDAWAAVRADLGPVKNYLGIVQALRPEATNPLVWTQVCNVAGAIDSLYVGGDPAARTAWRQAMIAVLRPVFEHYGWQPGTDEGAPVTELRAALIVRLGLFDDALTVGACRERFNAFLKDPAALPPDIRGAVCSVVGRHADAATYEELLAQARRATSDEQRHLFYFALANAANPALARKTMELAASDELQGSLAFRLIGSVAAGGEQPAAAVKFTLAHLDPLMKKISPMAKNLVVPGLYQTFNDAARADELENYAKQSDAVADPTQVKKAAESIRADADLKARLLPEIKLWAAGK